MLDVEQCLAFSSDWQSVSLWRPQQDACTARYLDFRSKSVTKFISCRSRLHSITYVATVGRESHKKWLFHCKMFNDGRVCFCSSCSCQCNDSYMWWNDTTEFSKACKCSPKFITPILVCIMAQCFNYMYMYRYMYVATYQWLWSIYSLCMSCIQ